MKRKIIENICLMRKELGMPVIPINKLEQESQEILINQYYTLLLRLPTIDRKIYYQMLELKEIKKRQEKNRESIYQSKKYIYLQKELKILLKIKKIRNFNQELKMTIQNEEDLDRILALIYYFYLLQNKIDTIIRIIGDFSNRKNFRYYLCEFPIENWETLDSKERIHSLKRILNDYFDLDV